MTLSIVLLALSPLFVASETPQDATILVDGTSADGSEPALADGSPPIAAADLEHPRKGRFVYEILTGVEFSQDREEFSEENFFLRFAGDTSWHTDHHVEERSSWLGDVHSSVAITLASIPAPETDGSEEFLTSKKAVSFSFGAESRAWKLPGEESTLFVGPILRGGFSTLLDSPDANEDVDTVSSFYGAGFRIGEMPKLRDSCNATLIRFVDVHYSRYEYLDDEWRWTFDALLRPRTESASGFFLGARALVGSGEDDVRIYAGISIDPEAVEKAISSIGGLVRF